MSITINPQTISYLLSLCPICPDIQFKIVMLFIGINGTPTSFIIKSKINRMKMYNKIKNKYVAEQSLTSYCKDLSLFNYLNWYYPEYLKDSDEEDQDEEDQDQDQPHDDKIYLPDFLYEIQMAYTLCSYYGEGDTFSIQFISYYGEEDINRIMNEYKESKKISLNKMIEEGTPYNI